MAGVPGFDPGDAVIRIQCLTAWRYPNDILIAGTTYITGTQITGIQLIGTQPTGIQGTDTDMQHNTDINRPELCVMGIFLYPGQQNPASDPAINEKQPELIFHH